MSVKIKLTGTNLFGGTEVIYCNSTELSKYAVETDQSVLEFFNTRSEYYAEEVKVEVQQSDGSYI